MLDWFAGKFTQAAAELGTATEDLARLGREEDVAAVWFVPNDGSTAMYVHLALARFMSADTAGADESLARAKAMAAELDFPQGPWSTAYALWLGSWVWIEDGRLDRAGDALVELRSSSARHGFDNWELVAATQTAALECVTALRAKTAGVATLLEHAEALGTHIELWKMIGLRVFLPFYITTAASVLAAAGDVAGARHRYEESLALAEETGMRFYDAETARCLAHLTADREAMIAELRAALDVARSQAARPFELRIALDLHALLGQAASPLVERAMRPYDEGALASEIEGLGLA
jgi:hypothetical protein